MYRKPIFDTVRQLIGRGFTRREVAAIDAAIDRALRWQDGPCAGPGLSLGKDGLALIRAFEGCARACGDGLFEAYPDPATGGAPWTIGWGATGPGIGPGVVWTEAQCNARLEADAARFAAEVAQALDGAPVSQAQFDALVSFHYNTGAIGRATLTKLHRAGQFSAAAAEFGRWIHAAGRPMKGLRRRRAEEAALYLSEQPA